MGLDSSGVSIALHHPHPPQYVCPVHSTAPSPFASMRLPVHSTAPSPSASMCVPYAQHCPIPIRLNACALCIALPLPTYAWGNVCALCTAPPHPPQCGWGSAVHSMGMGQCCTGPSPSASMRLPVHSTAPSPSASMCCAQCYCIAQRMGMGPQGTPIPIRHALRRNACALCIALPLEADPSAWTGLCIERLIDVCALCTALPHSQCMPPQCVHSTAHPCGWGCA